MATSKPDTGYLWDMLDAAKAIRDFVARRSLDDYLNDRMLRGAVERHIEIIGEAARHVSKAFRVSHHDIPWEKIVAQRHVLSHDYGDIEHPLIWEVATVHISDLIGKLEPLIPRPSEDPED